MGDALTEQRLTLMSHTLGSIGQLVKKQSRAQIEDSDVIVDEIERIYNGYIHEIKRLSDYIYGDSKQR